MPSDIGDEGMGGTDGLNDFTHLPNPFDQAENSYRSAHHVNTTGQGIAIPSHDEGPIPHRIRTKPPPIFGLQHQAAGRPEGVTTGDSGKYAPSPPFEEAGRTSSVWRAYLVEGYNHGTDIFGNQRGRLNILLVFAGLFSAIVTAFISQSSINIQRALTNGTSLDHITISGADPTTPFTPKYQDSVINGNWFTSLTLSLATSFCAILADQWYASYLSPITGTPQARARTWHFRYKALNHSPVLILIRSLPFTLNLSLYLFLISLWLYLSHQQEEIAITIGTISLLLYITMHLIGGFPIIYPESPYKDIIRRLCYPSQFGRRRRQLQDLEIYTAERSHIQNEVDALLWMYERSSTSAICQLVIHALAGLPPDYIGHANEAFSSHWDEMRNEKDRLLMDCMELSLDGLTRWIPKDIPNIDHRIEPLLRMEILFPKLCGKIPSRLFGGHNLDLSNEVSNDLAITLSSIDNPHIQKPTDQRRVVMDALADNDLHHPLVWKKLLGRFVDKGMLFHGEGDVVTIEMCLNLVKSIYLTEHSPPESRSCTLAYASVKYYKPEILKGFLSFFLTFESHNNPLVDLKQRLSLAIVRALVPDSAPSSFISHQRYPFHRDSTISKYRLLRVALHAIHKVLHDYLVDPPSKQWRTDAFWTIFSYMMSDLFTGRSLRNSEPSELKLFWTCRAHALACMASLMGGGPKYCIVKWTAEWAKKPLFLNILRVIHDEPVTDALRLRLSPVRVIPDPPQRPDSIIGVVGLLLDQAFKHRIHGAYEAFREKGSLRYIAEKSSLHPELIELLRVYITGVSKAANLPNIQSDIQDLHQATVIRCICASIARSGTEPRPILSSLVSIKPDHSEWDGILETLKSPTDENSIIKETVEMLDECLNAERNPRNGINQPSTSFNPHHGSPETKDGHGWLNWMRFMRKPRNGSPDEEAVELLGL